MPYMQGQHLSSPASRAALTPVTGALFFCRSRRCGSALPRPGCQKQVLQAQPAPAAAAGPALRWTVRVISLWKRPARRRPCSGACRTPG